MNRMPLIRLIPFVLLSLLPVLVPAALADLPKDYPRRDLSIEIREIEEGRDEAGTYRAGTQPATAPLMQQLVRVRNGDKAIVRLQRSTPMVWVHSVQAGTGTSSASSVSNAASSGAGVSQALQWFDASQSLSVSPRWPGGRRDAVVEMEVGRSDVQPSMTSELPSQHRATLGSTVTVSLGEWVTVAASGNPSTPAKGTSYSSEAATHARRFLQIRVLAP